MAACLGQVLRILRKVSCEMLILVRMPWMFCCVLYPMRMGKSCDCVSTLGELLVMAMRIFSVCVCVCVCTRVCVCVLLSFSLRL